MDIRLGDIIVGHSEHSPDRSLVGFGREYNLTRPVTAFPPPPRLLLTALDRLKLHQGFRGSLVNGNIDMALKKHPYLAHRNGEFLKNLILRPGLYHDLEGIEPCDQDQLISCHTRAGSGLAIY